MQLQHGTGHSSGRWGWRQLPPSLLPQDQLPWCALQCHLLRSQLRCLSPVPMPQPEQGRTRFCLIPSLVSFPCCLKIQGDQRCKVTAVFVFLLYLGSRRAFLLCLLLPPAHQLQLEPGLWVDASMLRFRLPFPSHFVELAPDNKHWGLISYLFCSRMEL